MTAVPLRLPLSAVKLNISEEGEMEGKAVVLALRDADSHTFLLQTKA
jgi:hypothetical protein